jgi:hypothetical protein
VNYSGVALQNTKMSSSELISLVHHNRVAFGWFCSFLFELFLGLFIGLCRRFDPRGVPGPTSKLSPRAQAQMGRRETEHEGGKLEGDRRKGETSGLRVVLHPGRVRLQ